MKIKKEKSVSSMPYFIFFLILLLFALVKKDVMAIHAEPRKESLQGRLLYQKYEHALKENDSAREEGSFFSAAWDELSGVYGEYWSESYFGMTGNDISYDNEGEFMTGILAAYEGEGFGMRIAVRDEAGMLSYGYYQKEGFIYLSARGLSGRGEDLPEYTVCMQEFQQVPLSDSFHNALGYWETWISEYGRAAEERQAGELTEYCIVEGDAYLIDREEGTLTGISDQPEKYVVDWLAGEAERVKYQLLETEEMELAVRGLLPEGFAMTEEFAGCDLNRDGRMDYVAAAFLHHSGETEETLLMHNYSDAIWLFLSQGDGSYKKKQLTDTHLSCFRLDFVGDGLLACEELSDFGGYRYNPYRLQYFSYDPRAEDFYFMEDFQARAGGCVSIHGRESLGEFTMWDYYQYVHEGTEFGNELFAYDSYCLAAKNGEMFEVRQEKGYDDSLRWRVENAVMGQVWEAEYSLAGELAGSREAMERADGCIYSANIYMDKRIACKKVYAGAYQIVVLVDRRTGETVDIPQIIPLEEMLSICRKGMKDAAGSPIGGAEKQTYLRCLRENYGQINSMIPVSDLGRVGTNVRVSISLTAWGLHFHGVQENQEGDLEVFEFYVDKEYFRGTPMWKYMEPELLQAGGGTGNPFLFPAAVWLQQ